MLFISLLAMMAGLVIYAVNADCDIGVYGLKKVTRNDQVSRLFSLLGLYGLLGLYVVTFFVRCGCLKDVFRTL